MTKKILGTTLAAVLVGALAIILVQQVSAGPPSIGDDATERDNTTITKTKLQ